MLPHPVPSSSLLHSLSLRHLTKAITSSLISLGVACGGGTLGVLVTEYPIERTPATQEKTATRAPSKSAGTLPADTGSDSKDTESESLKYWSAYVYMETQDIQRLWSHADTQLNYALITAKVTIPTAGNPLVREFPLFTYENGVVDVHASVDLLQKVPILATARQAMTVTFEVTAFRTAESLELTRKVIRETTKLAEPFLGNYPVSSQIISGATSIIDGLVPSDQRSKNSMSTPIEQTLSDGRIRAFVLRPLANLKNTPTYAAALVSCADKEEALCTQHGEYRKHRVQDTVYITVKFAGAKEVYDTMILVPGDQCQVSLSDIERARTYVSANEALLDAGDVATARATFRMAEAMLRARELVDKGALDELVETIAALVYSWKEIDGGGSTSTARLHDISECFENMLLRQPPYREAYQVFAIDKVIRDECDKTLNADTCRLDYIVEVLSRFASTLSVNYNVAADAPSWGPIRSATVRSLDREAREIYKLQVIWTKAQLNSTPGCSSDSLVSSVSIHCAECLRMIRERCGTDLSSTLNAEVVRRTKLVRDGLRALEKD